MKRVQELAKENCKPIRQHFIKNKPAKTKVSRKIQKRKHVKMKIMLNNPLTNVYTASERIDQQAVHYQGRKRHAERLN
jgi:hypothetical protein